MNNSKDPLGHIKLSVSNFSKSRDFYSKLFEKLGFNNISNKERSAGWATKEGFGISIAQAEHKDLKHIFMAPGLHHLCFKAASKKQVDAVYEMIKEKTLVFDLPQKYPEYTKKYYAVFFSDPDGLKLEVAYY